MNYLFSENTTLAGQLLTVHNVAYMMQLVRKMRAAVLEGKYPEFVIEFLKLQFPLGKLKVPKWVVEALDAVGIHVSTEKGFEVERKKGRDDYEATDEKEEEDRGVKQEKEKTKKARTA